MLTHFQSSLKPCIPISYFLFSSIKDINSKADLPKDPSSYLLQFHASWCPPCKQLTPRLLKAFNEEKERGFDIYRVDIDTVKDLTKQYDVAAVPMLVGVVNGNIVTDVVGLLENADIIRIFETIERETKNAKQVTK